MSITDSALSVVIADQLSADNRLRRREGGVHPLGDRAFQSAAPSHRCPARRCRCHSRRFTCIGPNGAHLSDGPGIRTSSRVHRERQVGSGRLVDISTPSDDDRTVKPARGPNAPVARADGRVGDLFSKDPAALRGHETRGRLAELDHDEPPCSRPRRSSACPFCVLGAFNRPPTALANHTQQAAAPPLTSTFSWWARGDLNPHVLSDTGT